MGSSTIRDVARVSGVSVGTVSRYLNGIGVKDENARLIDRAVKELGYRLNISGRSMATGRTFSIGILVPSMCNVFAGELVGELEPRLERYGYASLVVSYHRDPVALPERLDFLLSRRVDGIIAFLSEIDVEPFRYLASLDVPAVIVDNPLEYEAADSVAVDNRDATAQMVGAMLDAGHRRIGILALTQDGTVARDRLEGWRLAHAERGITPDARDIAEVASRAEEAREITHAMLSGREVTAMFCCNYYLALGALKAMSEMGLTPGVDIGFASFDSLAFDEIFVPHLSVIRQPTAEMAGCILTAIMGRISGQIMPDGVHTVACEVNITDSIKGGLSSRRQRDLSQDGRVSILGACRRV